MNAAPTTSTFGGQATSAFGTPSAFSQPPAATGSAFGQTATTTSAFGTSAAAPAKAPASAAQSTPGAPKVTAALQEDMNEVKRNLFNTVPQPRQPGKFHKWDDPVIDYLAAELEAFKMDEFTFENIPLVAPPENLCIPLALGK